MYGYSGTALGFAAARWQWQPSPHDPSNIVELSDVAAVAINADLTTTEGTDTLSSDATVASAGITATLGATEANDTVASTAVLPITAAATYTEGADTSSGQSVLPIQATSSITEAGDTVASTAALAITAGLTQGEQADTVGSAATIGSNPIAADLTASEAPDSLTSLAILTPKANLAGGSYYQLFDPDRHRRKKKDDEDEAPLPKRPDMEIVATKEVVTGIVQSKQYGKKLKINNAPFERAAKRKSAADKARQEHFARLKAADDEWLMLA